LLPRLMKEACFWMSVWIGGLVLSRLVRGRRRCRRARGGERSRMSQPLVLRLEEGLVKEVAHDCRDVHAR
jgi:hypothetical protein